MSRLLIEGAVAQRLTSKDFTDAGWVKTRVTATAGQANDPAGAATLAKVADTVTTGVLSHTLVQSPTFTAGEVVTVEVMAKAAEYGFLQIAFGGTAFNSSTRRAFFNLNTGAPGTVLTSITARMVACGNGVFRCLATTSPSTTGSGTLTVSPAPTDGAATYEPVLGSGIMAGNAIMTTGQIGAWAPAGRAADHLRRALGANPGRGSIRIVAMLPTLPFTGLQRGLWVRDDGTAANRLFAYVDAAGGVFVNAVTGGAAGTAVAIGSVAPGVLFSLAGGFDAQGSTWSLNGIKAVTGPACPAAVTTERLGHAVADLSQPLIGEIGPAASWPGRLNAAAIVALAAA